MKSRKRKINKWSELRKKYGKVFQFKEVAEQQRDRHSDSITMKLLTAAATVLSFLESNQLELFMRIG